MKCFTLLKFQPFFALSLFFLFGNIAGAQNIGTTLAEYAEKYQPERVYLHYDKSVYSAGETIWFKAYLMENIIPADESKNLYIDWVDDNGKLLQHSVSPLVDATTNGQFVIPPDYKGKAVHVRAYTKWMLNFDTVFLYNKVIRILSRNIPSVNPQPAVITSLQFFPEGGDAIVGISNKIAFIANDQWGRPVKVKGTIQDEKGNNVVSFRSMHDGMGYFFLTPEKEKNYVAKWSDEKGVAHTTALPVIKPTGFGLQVTVKGTRRYFTINATEDATMASDSIHLVGTMYQNQAFQVTKSIKDLITQGIIPTENLPSGILTITLFDKHWNAMAERITYVNNNEYLFTPTMDVQHWGLSKRARNEVVISVPDSIQADLSVAVTDAAIETDSSDNIISRLMLTSELKGKVYDPWYYFSSTEDSVMQNLDLVMLTHGWRRFKWEDVVKGKFPVISYPKDTSYLSLSGKIYGALPSELSDAGNIILMMKQEKKEPGIYSVPIKRNGEFNDPSLYIFDSVKVYYQLPKSKGLSDAEVQFMINRMPAPVYKKMTDIIPYNLLTDTAGNSRHFMLADEAVSLEELQRVKILENVTVRAKTKSPLQQMDEKYSSGLFQGGDGYQFDLVNDPLAHSYSNVFMYLQGKVAGLQINNASSTPTLQWRGGAPQLFLDEMQTDASMLSSLNVNDIAYVKVFRPPFFGGFGGGSNGAIAIYTRKGNDVKRTPGKGLDGVTVTGYTPMKEFYSPNYDAFVQTNEQRDLRTTIFWAPRVILTPKQKKVVLTFFNNDVTQSFRVIIEGMTRDGRLAHVEQMME